MTPEQALEQARAQRFGWTSLLVWAVLGAALEAAHGFKLATYLQDDLTRMLLRLGHAHGVGLSLVVLAYSVTALPAMASAPGRVPLAGRLLRVAAMLVPLGFALSAFGHPEGDPSPAVFLVPIGACALLVALALIVRSLRRAKPG